MSRPSVSNNLCRLLLAAAAALLCVDAAQAQQKYELDAEGELRKQAELDPSTPRGKIQLVRKAVAQEEGKKAWQLADQWIADHPNHPLLPEAYLLRADALVVQRQYFKSLFDYEHVITVYPDSEQFNTALEREYKIATKFAAGMKRIFLGMRMLPAWAEAEELFIRIQERSPGSDVAERASLDLGNYYFNRSEMHNAAEAYNLFLENYPKSRFREKAVLRLIRAHLATFKGPRFDATGLIEASQRLKLFEQEFPVSAQRLGAEGLQLRIDESLALKSFYQAQWYERINQKVSGVYLYQQLVKQHPQTVAAKAAIRRLEQLNEPITADQSAAEADKADP